MIDMHSAIAEHHEEIVAVWYQGFEDTSTKEEVFIQGISASTISSDFLHLFRDNIRFSAAHGQAGDANNAPTEEQVTGSVFACGLQTM